MASAPERIGAIVDGRYKILERMAEGSMGVVYRGERVPVGKPVAVKFLHPAVAAYPEFKERFDRETHVMSRLAHPHCASVLDFGVDGGAPYIVMELVAGTTLRALLDRGPLPPATALALAHQLAAGLAHAHEQGIVHRDVKPANLMITDETGTGLHLRILDFGLARLCSAVGPSATQSHIAIGTPSYMAPEQTVGGTVDARADIYAAGVVLYEMLTGQKPFAADETLDLMAMHRGTPAPRLAEHVAALPAGVQELVDRAMAKAPAERFQSAIELAAAIDAVATGRAASQSEAWFEASQPEVVAHDPDETEEVEADPAPRGGVRGRTIAMFAVLVAIGAAALYLRYGRGASSTMTPSAAAPPPVVATKHAPAPVAPPPPPPKPVPSPPLPPAPDTPATSVADALALIKDGKRDLALTSLRALARKQPKNAQIPFLVGNLDFDQKQGAAALAQYRAAIALEPAYRGNAILARNAIQLLGAAKTRTRAAALLRAAGRPALPYLRDAAAHDPSAVIRKQAAALARSIR